MPETKQKNGISNNCSQPAGLIVASSVRQDSFNYKRIIIIRICVRARETCESVRETCECVRYSCVSRPREEERKTTTKIPIHRLLSNRQAASSIDYFHLFGGAQRRSDTHTYDDRHTWLHAWLRFGGGTAHSSRARHETPPNSSAYEQTSERRRRRKTETCTETCVRCGRFICIVCVTNCASATHIRLVLDGADVYRRLAGCAACIIGSRIERAYTHAHLTTDSEPPFCRENKREQTTPCIWCR